MPAKVSMDVDEYLHTGFDGPDCEYLDGEVVERNTGEKPHGRVQTRFGFLLMQLEERLGIEAVTEIRVQINPRRYRVADVAVWRKGESGGRIPQAPPFLVIEI